MNIISREDVLNLFGSWSAGPNGSVEFHEYVICNRHGRVEDKGRDYSEVPGISYWLAMSALRKANALLTSADCTDYKPKAEAKLGVKPRPLQRPLTEPQTAAYQAQKPAQAPHEQAPSVMGSNVEELLRQEAEQPAQQGTQFQLETTYVSVRAYERRPYTFANNALLLNGMLSLLEQGCRINPEDHSEIIFTGQEYLARTPQAMRAQEEAVRRLIGIDKRIEVKIAGRVEPRIQLEAMISSALQNPADAKGAREVLWNYFAQPN